MRFRNGLSIFEKCSGWGAYNIAAFHSPHSMTWTWLLSVSLPRRNEGRWFAFQSSKLGQEKWALQFLKFRLGWSTQEPMWFRDIWQREHERRLQREGMLWLPDDHPNKVDRIPARIPTPPAMGDGGTSRH